MRCSRSGHLGREKNTQLSRRKSSVDLLHHLRIRVPHQRRDVRQGDAGRAQPGGAGPPKVVGRAGRDPGVLACLDEIAAHLRPGPEQLAALAPRALQRVLEQPVLIDAHDRHGPVADPSHRHRAEHLHRADLGDHGRVRVSVAHLEGRGISAGHHPAAGHKLWLAAATGSARRARPTAAIGSTRLAVEHELGDLSTCGAALSAPSARRCGPSARG